MLVVLFFSGILDHCKRNYTKEASERAKSKSEPGTVVVATRPVSGTSEFTS